MPSLRLLLAVLFTVACAAQVHAAGIAEQTAGNIRYLSGGIGQDEAQAMREAASRYNLAMTFTIATGQYISDVKVDVKNRAGETILSTVSQGPMMLMDMPPGPYTVEATFEGKTMKRKVSIAKGKHQKLVLRWPGTGSA